MAFEWTRDLNKNMRVTQSTITAAPCTLSCWFYLNNGTHATQGLVLVQDIDVGTHYMRMHVNGTPALAMAASAGSSSASPGATTLSTGVWYHGIASFRASNDRELYLNGVSDATSTASRAAANLDSFCHGSIAYTAANTSMLEGYLAEVGIWSSGFSDAEAAELYAAGGCPLMMKQKLSTLVSYKPLLANYAGEFGWGPDYTAQGSPAASVIARHPPVKYPFKRNRSAGTPKIAAVGGIAHHMMTMGIGVA